MHGTIDVELVPHPALDAGDVIVLVEGNNTTTHIIDTLTIPLDPTTTQRITTRSMDIPPEV
jgi:hypothetical protein